MLEISFYLVLLIMSNGHEAKILTPYIHALKDVDIRLYLIEKHKGMDFNHALFFVGQTFVLIVTGLPNMS